MTTVLLVLQWVFLLMAMLYSVYVAIMPEAKASPAAKHEATMWWLATAVLHYLATT